MPPNNEFKQGRAPMAPDGAPYSNIVMTQQRSETIEVTHVDNPKFRMKIAVRDFDPAIHRKVAPATGKAPRERVRIQFGKQTEEELLTSTMATLRAMPEYSLIEEPSSAKSELVQQILAVRETP